MPKLTDTQLVILSAAARREDGAALPLPKSLKIRGGAVTKTLDSLRKKGLLEEKPASRETPAWREGKDGRRLTLVITEAGLRALGAEPGLKPDKAPAARSEYFFPCYVRNFPCSVAQGISDKLSLYQ